MKNIQTHSFSSVLKLFYVILSFVFFINNTDAQEAKNSPRLTHKYCTLIDNDYDIDDMMAIPLLIGNTYVAAIIQTEGFTLPQESAAAIDQLVNNLPDQPNQRKIPIIVGGFQSIKPDLNKWPWVQFFRSMMNLSNGLIKDKPQPMPGLLEYPQRVKAALQNCNSVTILLIGTYTSFIKYNSLISDKIEKVVILGQPIGDKSRTPGKESFNCQYDFNSCKKAMNILSKFKTAFIEIPRLAGCSLKKHPDYCYTPSKSMVDGELEYNRLTPTGLPGHLKQALINNIDCSFFFKQSNYFGKRCSSLSTWVPKNVFDGPGGEILFWDQTAALYLLHPELFKLYYPSKNPKLGGKHYEPIIVAKSHSRTIERLRLYWTRDTNRSIKFYE